MPENITMLATVPRLLAEAAKRRDHDLVTFGGEIEKPILGFKDKTDENKIFAVTTETLDSWYAGPLKQFMFMRDLLGAKEGCLQKRVLDAIWDDAKNMQKS